MFVYNITMKADWTVHDEWLTWLKKYHIPAIMEYRCFTGYKLLKLHEVDESDGATYALQFTAATKADYKRYIRLYAGEILTIEQKFWGTKVFTFGTIMEILQQ